MANESKRDMLSPFPENPPSPLESSTKPLQSPQTPESSSTPDSSPTVIEMAKRNAPNQDTAPSTPDTPPRIPKTQEQLKEALKQRAQVLFKSIEGKLDELAKRDQAGEFKDKPNEPKGSGETRLEQAKEEIQGNVGRLEQMKVLLDSGANLSDEEPVPQDINDFFTPELKNVFGTPKNGYIGTYVNPRTQDYAILKDDKESTKFGDYTLNADTQNIDFTKIPENKIHTIHLPQYAGKPIHEVMQHIAQAYPNYKLPGLEYWEWLIKNHTKTPNKLKDTQLWFYFPGSLVRNSYGYWYVPYVAWNDSSWHRNASWPGSSWDANYRIILLEI